MPLSMAESQAMDLARTDLQRNAVERFDAGKVFLDIQRPQ